MKLCLPSSSIMDRQSASFFLQHDFIQSLLLDCSKQRLQASMAGVSRRESVRESWVRTVGVRSLGGSGSGCLQQLGRSFMMECWCCWWDKINIGRLQGGIKTRVTKGGVSEYLQTYQLISQIMGYKIYNLRTILFSLLFVTLTHTYDLYSLNIRASDTTINTITDYTFTIDRGTDSSGNTAPWSTTPVPAGSNITVKFPSQYTIPSNITCPTHPTCLVSGRDILIPNAYPVQSFPQVITVTVHGILNPSPAIVTGEFLASVGNQQTKPGVSNLGVVWLTPGTFTSCSVTFSPGFVNKTANMVVSVTPRNELPSGGWVEIGFPVMGFWKNDLAMMGQMFKLSSVMSCASLSANVQSGLQCTGELNNRTLAVSNLSSSATTTAFSFSVAGLTSPPTPQPADILTITSYSGTSQIDTCQTTISSLLPNPLSTFSITATTTMTVNRPVSLRFTATLSDTISRSNLLLITLPVGSNFTLGTYFTSPGSHVLTQNSNLITVTLSSTFKPQPAGTVLTITMGTYTAPSSTQVTGQFGFAISLNNYTVQSATATIQAVPSTVVFKVVAGNLEVSKVTSYVFNLTIADAIGATGRVRVDFPTGIAVAVPANNCVTMSGVNVSSAGVVCSQPTATSVLLSNISLNSISRIPAQSNLLITFPSITNPSSTQPTGPFTLTTYFSTTDDTLVATSTSQSITAVAGTITNTVVTPSNWTVGATNVTYVVEATVANAVGQGGRIGLRFPTELGRGMMGALGVGRCGVGVGSNALVEVGCVGNGDAVNFTIDSFSIPAGSKVSLRINSYITNPSSTKPVSPFTIDTYSSTGFQIDTLKTVLSVAMTIPASFNSISVSRSSTMNSANSSYTFTLSQPSTLQPNSLLLIDFPTQIPFPSPPTCTDPTTSTTLPCTLSSNTLTIPLGSPSNTNIAVTITPVANPPSLQPSSPFSFRTTTSTNNLYSQANNNLTITNTLPSVFKTLTGVFSNRTYNSNNNLTIQFTPSSSVNGWVLVGLASSMTPGTIECVPTCSVSGRVVNISSVFGAGVGATVTISGMVSPKTQPNDFTSVRSFDAQGFLIDSDTSSIIFTVNCTMPCQTCDTTATNCTSCYTDTSITNRIYHYPTNFSCLSSCPSNLGLLTDTTNFQCLTCSSPCLTCSGTVSNCTSCIATFPYLNITTPSNTCLKTCPTSLYPDTTQITPTCLPCESPCSTCTTKNSCLSCVSPFFMSLQSLLCITTCPPNTTIPNFPTRTCDPCAVICSTCSLTPTNCTACSPTSALHNGTCVSTCPTGLVIKNGQCVGCDSPCLTCVNTAGNCTSCDQNTLTKYLKDNVCLTGCPSRWYQGAGVCLECRELMINCDICLSASECSTVCNAGFVYFNKQCLGTVPQGYVNISGMAEPCLGDCATCSVTQTNCTSCRTLNQSGNLCVALCPAGTASVNNICTPCTSPCYTCTNTPTTCLTCDPSITPLVFLSNSRCVTTCPSLYVFPNPIDNTCTACISPCSTCNSSTSCLSCVTGYNLHGTTCSNNCPTGFVNISSVCQKCLQPCATCDVTQSNCTSCVVGLGYLVGNMCVTQCPEKTYANITTLQCTPCTPPCQTCTTSLSCLSCSTGSLYLNSCPSTCPSGFTSKNSICQKCNTGCLTCLGDPSICLTCSTSYFMIVSSATCVKDCSPLFADVLTQRCVGCTQPCSTCVGVPSNCTACLVGSLMNGSCLEKCPVMFYADAGRCQACPQGCLECVSSTVCLTCLSGYYQYQTLCYNPCPSHSPVLLKNNTCTSCSTPSCQSCTPSDYCTTCFPPKLSHLGSCLTTCPLPYSSNTTHCQLSIATQQLQASMSSAKLFPYPMTIGLGIVVLVCSLSKLANSNTFLAGSVFGLASIIEMLAHGYFIYLLYFLKLNTFYDGLMYVAMASMLGMSVLNVCCTVTMCVVMGRDKKFRTWFEGTGNKITYVMVSIFGLVVNLKMYNLVFSKLFNFSVFKAKLDHVSKFFCLHFFSFLSLLHSFSAIAASGYTLYTLSDSPRDQLYISCIDLIIVIIIQICLSVLNAHKDQSYFQQVAQQGLILGRKFDVAEDESGTSSVVEEVVSGISSGIRPGSSGTSGIRLVKGRPGSRQQLEEEVGEVEILTVVDEQAGEDSELVTKSQMLKREMARAALNPEKVDKQQDLQMQAQAAMSTPKKKTEYKDQSNQIYEILEVKSEEPSEQNVRSPRAKMSDIPNIFAQAAVANPNPTTLPKQTKDMAISIQIQSQLNPSSNNPSNHHLSKNHSLSQKAKDHKSEIQRIKKMILQKQKNLRLSSGLTESYASSIHTELDVAKSAWRDSKLVELREKSDFDRTEQLEVMGLKRPDQLMAGQGALPVERGIENPSFLQEAGGGLGGMRKDDSISLEEEDFPDYNGNDGKGNYASVPVKNSKSLPPFVLSASSPITTTLQPSPNPGTLQQSSKQVQSIDPSLSISHYQLQFFKDQNSKLTLSKDQLGGFGSSSGLRVSDTENIKSRRLQKSKQNAPGVIQEVDEDQGDKMSNNSMRLSQDSVRRKEMMKTNPMLWKKGEVQEEHQEGLDLVDIGTGRGNGKKNQMKEEVERDLKETVEKEEKEAPKKKMANFTSETQQQQLPTQPHFTSLAQINQLLADSSTSFPSVQGPLIGGLIDNFQDLQTRLSKLKQSELKKASTLQNQLNTSTQNAQTLQNSGLQNSNFQKSNLQNSSLQNSNLQNSNLQKSTTQNPPPPATNLQASNLQQSNFYPLPMNNPPPKRKSLQESVLEPSREDSREEIHQQPMYVKLQSRESEKETEMSLTKGASKQSKDSFDSKPQQLTQQPQTTTAFTKKPRSNNFMTEPQQLPTAKFSVANYRLESSGAEEDLWQHPAHVKLQHRDTPLQRQQSEDQATQFFQKGRLQRTQTQDVSFGMMSKDGTTEMKSRQIQGDYLSESETSGMDYINTEKDRRKVERKGNQTSMGEDTEFGMTTIDIGGGNPQQRKFLFSAGHKQQPIYIGESGKEEVSPRGRQDRSKDKNKKQSEPRVKSREDPLRLDLHAGAGSRSLEKKNRTQSTEKPKHTDRSVLDKSKFEPELLARPDDSTDNSGLPHKTFKRKLRTNKKTEEQENDRLKELQRIYLGKKK